MNNSMVPVLYSTVPAPALLARRIKPHTVCRIRRYEYSYGTRPYVRVGEIHAEIFN